MDATLQKKLVFGTTYKAHQKAKIYGKICLVDLDLLDIILDLVHYCQLNLDHTTQSCLEQKARDLQNKNKDICNYRNANYNDKKFLN
jgi:hypothetical protein|tara:strand:- start:6762 stop:7022 length:261 start_codon:yes stop_codon:yes gene_type:complete